MTKFWWIKNDACGIFSAVFTVALLVYAQIVMTKYVLLPWMGVNIHLVLFSSCTLLALIAHTRAQFTDPGAVPQYFTPPELPSSSLVVDSSDPPPVALKICKACYTLKPKTAYHCSTCRRCIVRMDHHCPWINNCVGVHNQKNFLLFLLYTGLACVYSGVILVMRFFACSNSPRKCDITGLQSALCIITFVEALVFGLFVVIMMFDQLSAIVGDNEDAQAHYEDEMSKYNTAMRRGVADYMPMPSPPPPKSTYVALKEVFGGPFSLAWFLPFNSPKGLDELYDRDLEKCRHQAEKNLDIIVRHVQQSMMRQKLEDMRDGITKPDNGDEDEDTCDGDDAMTRDDDTVEEEPTNTMTRRGGDQSTDKQTKIEGRKDK